MKSKLKYILINNWTIAFLLTISVILFLKPVSQKYQANLVESTSTVLNNWITYADLDFDGISEKIYLEINQEGFGSIKVYNPVHVGQFNSNTNLPLPYNKILVSDLDSDGIKEIYFMGLRNDSVFVNQVKYKSGKDPIEYFIVALPSDNDANISLPQIVNCGDQNELLIVINAGFSLQPRKLYLLNTATRKVKKTMFTGFKVRPQEICDLNNNGKSEIICGTFASWNYEEQVAFSDSFSWLMVVDNHLDTLFNPIQFPGGKTTANAFSIQNNGKKYIFAYVNVKTQSATYSPYFIFDIQGNLVKKDSLNKLNAFIDTRISKLDFSNAKTEIITNDGRIFEFDNSLNLVFQKDFCSGRNLLFLNKFDLNNNQKEEFIFRNGNSNEFIFFDDEMKQFTSLNLPIYSTGPYNLSLNKQAGKNPELVVQVNSQLFSISYKQNPLWNFRFVIWFAIFALFYGFIWLIQYIQKERIKAQIQAKHQIRELQFKVITSQLNPHFTFNALTSISSSLYNSKEPEIYDRFTTFSRLIRTILSDSDKIARSLKSEIDFTKDFLTIQKARFNHSFTYKFIISKGVDLNIKIPKLIIQLFVENAIKHAFPCKPGTDKLEIRLFYENSKLCIEIEDNGIGREKASENRGKDAIHSTGIGLKTVQSFIDLLNKKNKSKISFNISDLNREKNSRGTLVRILIPIKYSYSVN